MSAGHDLHGHIHGSTATAHASRHFRVLLAVVVGPLIAATVVGVVLLWPNSVNVAANPNTQLVDGTVQSMDLVGCDGVVSDQKSCVDIAVKLHGERAGETVTYQHSIASGIQIPKPGAEITLQRVALGGSENNVVYSYFDRQRRSSMLVLGIAFVGVALLIGRRRGLRTRSRFQTSAPRRNDRRRAWVLDDVTVTQASAVWELHQAKPTLGLRGLYRSAMRIGQDHIASTVNTLVLAYAGASLPLMLLFAQTGSDLGRIVTGEIVATEVVRTVVGSIGLMASVPVTTFLTALLVSGERFSPSPSMDVAVSDEQPEVAVVAAALPGESPRTRWKKRRLNQKHQPPEQFWDDLWDQ